MLTETQINENKNRFLDLISSITREGANIELLKRQLTESDFFTAPASTVYHCSFRGGLCYHSLNVYDTLCTIMKARYGENCPYSDETLKIVALLHDISKMNFYEIYYQNKKVYSDNGSKRDEIGKFDWQSIPAYKIKDASERFIFANHEYNSLYMIETFIPLSLEESTAIIHHMGSMATDSAKDDLPNIFSKYNLAMFLYLADMWSTYSIENEQTN